MFTDKAQAIIDLSKDYAYSSGGADLGVSAVLAATVNHTEAGVLLAEVLALTMDKLRDVCPKFTVSVACPGKLPLTEGTRLVLTCAKELSEEVPDRQHPGLIDVRHLSCALASSLEVCGLMTISPVAREDIVSLLASWYEKDAQTPHLEELTERLRGLRADLLAKVYGQDHAIHAFIEGLFNAEVVAAADTRRKSPRALFVFAGPPGVGKTFLAELGASALDRPLKRFDMSAFSGHQQNEALVGMSKSYHGAHPGSLTEFVEKNPNAILLFDEIEKAHTNTIHLFLQILDAGTLEDKYHERNIFFRDTTIIFTTNAGRKLYDRPNESGVHKANATFHRKTILDALENEKNPLTREPFFPAAICSRMATGYPVLFNHLRVNELVRVVQSELNRVAGLFERQYFKKTTFYDLLAMCLVLREGAKVDARTLRSQAEAFVKTEIFKFCQLFKTDRLEDLFGQINRIHFSMDENLQALEPEVRGLFEQPDRPRILLVADQDLTALYRDFIPQIEWFFAQSTEDALQVLGMQEVDMVLADLWIGKQAQTPTMTIQHFDHVPLAARGLDQGQELLRKIHERLPGMPVYLLSLTDSDEGSGGQGSIDDELFMACVRGGGARGMISSSFIDGMIKGWETHRDKFTLRLVETCGNLYREKVADKQGQEHKVLTFDTVPQVRQEEGEIVIRLRNLRLTRAIAAADADEVLDDVERPRTKFDDVIGADAAKEELKFFIDYLKNPRRFAALGIKPPKGILLYGPPGTGKTMLARAMAGESNVAFIPATASNFVTMWQGSGPQNIRDLFARARRYAPAIVFIDEIDTIGKVRLGGPGSQAEENTLNALLTEMDGFTSPSPDRPVFVLAATNFNVDSEDQNSSEEQTYRTLDPALVRRFSRKILVDLPDRAAREFYLANRLENRPSCTVPLETIKLIAERSSGMSIANLESIIETAARQAVKAGCELTDKILEEAFETVRFGEARSKTPEEVKRTARHEAGHTILYWLSGWWPAYVTVVSRGDHGGYMAPCAEQAERRSSLTRRELLNQICVALGGRAVELMYYGRDEGLSIGASKDLETATNIARAMVSQLGMDEEFGLVVDTKHPKINEYANKLLNEQMGRTIKLLEENRQYLEAVVEALVAKERVTSGELHDILPLISHIKARP